jgi:hypothetical protein
MWHAPVATCRALMRDDALSAVDPGPVVSAALSYFRAPKNDEDSQPQPLENGVVSGAQAVVKEYLQWLVQGGCELTAVHDLLVTALAIGPDEDELLQCVLLVKMNVTRAV